MYVKLDERNRLTLPKSAAVLFEGALVDVEKKDGCVILKPVKKPFSDLKGLIKTRKPFREIRRELAQDIENGRIQW